MTENIDTQLQQLREQIEKLKTEDPQKYAALCNALAAELEALNKILES